MKLDDFKEKFLPRDVFVIDRGFGSVKDDLVDAGFNVKIPPHLTRGQKQLTTEQANQQRQCTAVRWIVEVVNRLLKCNSYIAKTLCIQSCCICSGTPE